MSRRRPLFIPDHLSRLYIWLANHINMHQKCEIAMNQVATDWHTSLCETLIKARALADQNGQPGVAALVDMALKAAHCPDETVTEAE